MTVRKEKGREAEGRSSPEREPSALLVPKKNTPQHRFFVATRRSRDEMIS